MIRQGLMPLPSPSQIPIVDYTVTSGAETLLARS
jgi:hypothetical protein